MLTLGPQDRALLKKVDERRLTDRDVRLIRDRHKVGEQAMALEPVSTRTCLYFRCSSGMRSPLKA